ncbi:MAG TPA: multiheme c-type cytochrome [Bacteroidota bacterium]|nr:multiheme c-type cytochrome [Bacteroidota bacterium]
MRKILHGFLMGGIVLLAAEGLYAQNQYVGVKMCSPCHKTDKQGKQFDVWQKSRHSGAYKTLTTPKANEIAKAKGFSTAAAETKECLECHSVTGDAKLFAKTFDVKDGVQCEKCHNAGSAYKTLTIMKDKAKSVAAGLHEFKDEAAIEAFCKTCHNEKSPTFKEFKFKEQWDSIKHPVPKG